ncbi:MAG: baseplate J/gp47 family protein, partial [Lachnospiraceae bacterium]|nr:baseplate J/gp47 family protein [Lachnospiraceae bacterium]
MELDSRTREHLIRTIRKKAEAYTPEWRFDEAMPDSGAVLAFLFADMFSGTIQHFNRISEKCHIAFLNKLQAHQRPATPAEGYITFFLVNNDVEGTPVQRGTQLIADGEDGRQHLFETTDDVFVIPSALQEIFLSVPSQDKISLLYEKTEEAPFAGQIPLFCQDRENLQVHSITIQHKSVLNISKGSEITVTFTGKDFEGRSLLAKDHARFAYYSEEGLERFAEERFENGAFVFTKGAEQPPFAMLYDENGDEQGYGIRIDIKDGRRFRGKYFENIYIRSKGEAQPELIYADGAEQPARIFFPFGERPMPYMECYVASDEVFGKKNAVIHMEFDLDFLRVPLEEYMTAKPINWKLIMRRSEIKVDQEYDISIRNVIWEYYNGEGFRRLFENDRYDSVFSIDSGTNRRRVNISFHCPPDIQPFLVNSESMCCIRIRVVGMNNFYKMRGNYMVPRISLMKLRYEYNKNDLMPDLMIQENNLEREIWPAGQLGEGETQFAVAECRSEDKMCMYMGFDKPIDKGPVRFLALMAEGMEEALPNVGYEYYGDGRFKSLNVIDETSHFKRTGLVTFMGQTDFAKTRLFGRERYWIRLVDYDQGYEHGTVKKRPYIKGIHFNSTAIKGMQSAQEELLDRIGGNLPAGSIRTLASDIGFISGVCNYQATSGALAQESVGEVVERSEAMLRHGGRAVTCRDFEDLAKEASRSIIRARCFSNLDRYGNRKPGAVTLVLLQKDYEQGRQYFEVIRERTINYIVPRMPLGAVREENFSVREPDFVALHVSAALVVDTYN